MAMDNSRERISYSAAVPVEVAQEPDPTRVPGGSGPHHGPDSHLLNPRRLNLVPVVVNRMQNGVQMATQGGQSPSLELPRLYPVSRFARFCQQMTVQGGRNLSSELPSLTPLSQSESTVRYHLWPELPADEMLGSSSERNAAPDPEPPRLDILHQMDLRQRSVQRTLQGHSRGAAGIPRGRPRRRTVWERLVPEHGPPAEPQVAQAEVAVRRLRSAVSTSTTDASCQSSLVERLAQETQTEEPPRPGCTVIPYRLRRRRGQCSTCDNDGEGPRGLTQTQRSSRNGGQGPSSPVPTCNTSANDGHGASSLTQIHSFTSSDGQGPSGLTQTLSSISSNNAQVPPASELAFNVHLHFCGMPLNVNLASGEISQRPSGQSNSLSTPGYFQHSLFPHIQSGNFPVSTDSGTSIHTSPGTACLGHSSLSPEGAGPRPVCTHLDSSMLRSQARSASQSSPHGQSLHPNRPELISRALLPEHPTPNNQSLPPGCAGPSHMSLYADHPGPSHMSSSPDHPGPSHMSLSPDHPGPSHMSFSPDCPGPSRHTCVFSHHRGPSHMTICPNHPGPSSTPVFPESPGQNHTPSRPDRPDPSYSPISPDRHDPSYSPISPDRHDPSYSPISPDRHDPSYSPISPDRHDPSYSPISPDRHDPSYSPISPDRPGPSSMPPHRPGTRSQSRPSDRPGPSNTPASPDSPSSSGQSSSTRWSNQVQSPSSSGSSDRVPFPGSSRLGWNRPFIAVDSQSDTEEELEVQPHPYSALLADINRFVQAGHNDEARLLYRYLRNVQGDLSNGTEALFEPHPTPEEQRRELANLSPPPGIPHISPAVLEKVLECPVCFNYMKSPIFLCCNGHNICAACFEKLDNNWCPVCRGTLTKTRNIALEQIAIEIEYEKKQNDN